MRYNLVLKNGVAPPPYECELVEYNPIATPYVLGALWLRSQKYWWLSTDDQKYGRRLMAQIGSQVLMGCSQEIVGAVNQVYRLMDSTFNQQYYTWWNEPDLPADIRPAIPVVPNPTAYTNNSWRKAGDITRDGWQNLLTGDENNTFAPSSNFRVTLEQILAAIEAGEPVDLDEVESLLLQVVTALGA